MHPEALKDGYLQREAGVDIHDDVSDPPLRGDDARTDL